MIGYAMRFWKAVGVFVFARIILGEIVEATGASSDVAGVLVLAASVGSAVWYYRSRPDSTKRGRHRQPEITGRSGVPSRTGFAVRDRASDRRLSESAWFDGAYERHQTLRSRFYGPPEVQAGAAQGALAAGDVGVAMFFAQRALNTLEDTYRVGRMETRRPSGADYPMIETLEDCIAAALEDGREASARQVAGAAKVNLRVCAEEAEGAGFDPIIYSTAVERLDRLFSDLRERHSF